MVLLVLQLWLQLERCSDWMQHKHLIKGFLCKELLFHLLPTKNRKQIQTLLILFFARIASKSNTNLLMWGSSLVHPSQPSIRLHGTQLQDSAPCQTQEPWCCIGKVEASKTRAPFPPMASSSTCYQNKTPGLLLPQSRGAPDLHTLFPEAALYEGGEPPAMEPSCTETFLLRRSCALLPTQVVASSSSSVAPRVSASQGSQTLRRTHACNYKHVKPTQNWGSKSPTSSLYPEKRQVYA